MEKRKKRFKDRKDGYYLGKEVPALTRFMVYLLPKRTENEAVVNEKIDLTALNNYIKEKNAALGENDFKYTIFQFVVAAMAKTIYHREKLNYFIQGRRYYERKHISFSFVIKKKFEDKAEEALAIIKAGTKGVSPLEEVREKIKKAVYDVRVNEKTDGTTGIIEKLVKLPRFLLRFVCRVLRFLDYHGWTPSSLMKEDPYYSTVFISNLGSIKMHADYHHLTDYGTNSLFVIVGEKHPEPVFKQDGSFEMKEFLPIGLTVDERIADGLCFANSVKLLKKYLSEPELLEENVEVE